MSTDQSAMMVCSRGVKEGAAHFTCGLNTWVRVNLRSLV